VNKPRRPSLATVEAAGASAIAEAATQAPALHAWPSTVDALLKQLECYAKYRVKFPELELVLFGWTLTRKEVDGVLGAEDRLAAATALYSQKINRLD
jgi:hypothetical protein